MDHIRVVLVDNEEMVLEGLKGMLGGDLGIEVVGTAPGGKRALEQLDSLGPDILITDMKMPGMDGVELPRRVKTRGPKCRVIMLTWFADFLSVAYQREPTKRTRASAVTINEVQLVLDVPRPLSAALPSLISRVEETLGSKVHRLVGFHGKAAITFPFGGDCSFAEVMEKLQAIPEVRSVVEIAPDQLDPCLLSQIGRLPKRPPRETKTVSIVLASEGPG
ncbi:hypothetical protein LCGC14_2470280 [marine sediment metagenome]|uniref:Response regulatory domain-containing protein n=1 Tax=marine sediment metagenome TaxID=412755 RepID=A0A0F9BB97_9ZZZZ